MHDVGLFFCFFSFYTFIVLLLLITEIVFLYIYTMSYRKSWVWDHFEIDDSSKKAICLICKSLFSYCGSTSALGKHIRTKHPQEAISSTTLKRTVDEGPSTSSSGPTEKKTMYQPTLTEVQEKNKLYPVGSKMKEAIDQKLVQMVVKDMQPFSIVEDEGFRDYSKILNPRYALPSRRTLTRSMIPELYRVECARLSLQLEKAHSVAITTDSWTSRNNQSYLGVTAHFIDVDWKLHSAVLETAHMPTSHTSANLAAELKRIFQKWNIHLKIERIVTDNAANIVKAVRDLEYPHLPCFAHTINLVVQDALKSTVDVAPIIAKVKSVVRFFHHSTSATAKLFEFQQQHNRKSMKLIQEVETRWNSTYYMLQRYSEEQKMITLTLGWVERSDLILTSEENATVEILIQALKPFEQVTLEMSGEKFTSLSKVIPLQRGILECLSSPSVKDLPIVRNLRHNMSSRFSFVEERTVNATSTFLDPRMKKLAFSLDSGIKKAETEIFKDLSKLESAQQTSHQKNPAPLQNTETPRKETGIWAVFDNKVQKHISQASVPVVRPQLELTRYNQEMLIPRNQDPLQWWRENEAMFPLLKNVAKRYLCIPATSVPSERLFSKAGELISHRRNGLSPNNVDMVLFLNKNVKSEK